MKRARFPARGSVVTRPLAPAPTRGETESNEAWAARVALVEALSGVEVDVVLLGRAELVDLSHRFAVWGATEERRKRDAEAAGQPITVLSSEGTAELRALQRAIVTTQVRGVRGLTVGDQDSEGLSSDALADLIDAAGLLADVANLARAAQSPTPVQMER